MPTYDYACDRCGHRFEQLQSITAAPLRKCPACGQRALQRLLGTGGGIIFRGSGFYQTDYRSESYKKGERAEKAEKTGGGGSGDGKNGDAKKPEKVAGGESKKSKTTKSLSQDPSPRRGEGRVRGEMPRGFDPPPTPP